MNQPYMHTRFINHVDVHDLSKNYAELIATFVEFLRQQREHQTYVEADERERDWTLGASMSFESDWNNDKDALYDNWQEHYHVQTR